MCFSAPASFIASTALISIDVFCLFHLRKKDQKYVLFALIPFFFGIQQFLEGCIWLSVNGANSGLTKLLGFIYLFFAFCFWPIFVPMAVFLAEQQKEPLVKRWLSIMLVTGIAVGLACYIPILLGTVTFHVQTLNHSIAYITSRSVLLDAFLLSLYIFAIITPFWIVSEIQMQRFGYILLSSVCLTFLFYRYAFYSVWCFFAAILSIYIAHMLYHLPEVNLAGRRQSHPHYKRLK